MYRLVGEAGYLRSPFGVRSQVPRHGEQAAMKPVNEGQTPVLETPAGAVHTGMRLVGQAQKAVLERLAVAMYTSCLRCAGLRFCQ